MPYCILGIWKMSGMIHFYQRCLWLTLEDTYEWEISENNKQKMEYKWANPQIKESITNS